MCNPIYKPSDSHKKNGAKEYNDVQIVNKTTFPRYVNTSQQTLTLTQQINRKN